MKEEMKKDIKEIKEEILDSLEDGLDEDGLNERLSNYSDRQIVTEVLGILTINQLRKLVKILENNY